LVLRGGQRAIFEVNRVTTKHNAEEYGGANLWVPKTPIGFADQDF